MAKETIIIDGVRYYADRPRSCRGCFFWKNRKVGCTLAGCSYGPCVSFCMKKCMNEVLGTRMEVPANA